MLQYKMICTDLDGTLIGTKQQYGAGLKEAIKRYEKAGGKFVIVTGRMTDGALPVCHDLDLHGEVITYQGALTTDIDSEKVLDSVTLDWRLATKISQFLEEKGYYFQTYKEPYFLTEKATDKTHLYQSIAHSKFVELGEKVSCFLAREKHCPPKLLLIDHPKKTPLIRDEIIGAFGKEILVNISQPFIVEMIPKATSKGLATAKLANKYGIKQEEVICVGDSDNDITLLEYGGLSVCVASGSDGAKKCADVIAPHCDNDPITWLIDHYGLKEQA